jgi:plasmid maintenance system antidote protein VapI
MTAVLQEFLEAKAKIGKSWTDVGAVLDVAPRFRRQTACAIVNGRRSASLETLIKMGSTIGLDDTEVFKIWKKHLNT